MKRFTILAIATFALGMVTTAGTVTASPARAEVNATTAQVAQVRSDLIDINSASLKDLQSLPGVGETYSKRIVKGRPYKAVEDLKTRKVLPKGVFAKIQDKVVARTP